MMVTRSIFKDKWLVALVLSLLLLIGLFTLFLGPHVLGDTPTYLEAMNVVAGKAPSVDFMPNRIITTFGAMELVRALAVPFGGVLDAWFFLNCTLFVLAGILFYKLLVRLFGTESTAFIGTLFLAGNYGFLVFGLNYLMDIGGWSFYIFSLYFLFKYAQSKSYKDIVLSALMVGVGGLFKEYAFLAAVAIATYLTIDAWPSLKTWSGWKRFVGQGLFTGTVALLPVAILYLWAYRHFGYTYADWFGANAMHYVYPSRIKEYVKAFGSLVNILGLLFIGGTYVLVRSWHELSGELKTFITATLLSFLPIFFWPAITQRILTITIPFVIIVSCFLFRKYESRWYLFLPILGLYIVATFFMDSYLLAAVNLPF